ncbi:MAG: ABC transporter permease [Chloroflexi bacterium]|nr:ABC transporter permease [Chloroflexota bacterium]
MLGTRVRKVMRDILSRKARTALVAASIFIGVVGVITIWSAGDILIQTLLEDIREEDLAMQQLFIANPGDTPVEDPDALLESVLTEAQLEGVELTKIEGRATYPVQFRLDEDEESFSDGNIRAFSKSFDEIEVNPMRLTDGRYPEPGQSEIAIEQRMLEKYELEIGDTIQLRVLSGEADAEGELPVETWTIVGSVLHPFDDWTNGLLQSQNEAIYANFDDAAYVGGFNSLNAILTRYSDYETAQEQSDAFIETLQSNTPYVKTFNFMDDPENNITLRISREYTGVLNMLGIVAMLVSGFLVINVINTTVVEQKKQIGIMKSLGATGTEVFTIYAGVAFVYGLLGMIPGVLIGVPAGNELAKIVGPLANTYISGWNFSPTALTLGVVLGLAVPVGAAIIPVILGTRVTILDAMTDLGISTHYGSGPVARFIGGLPFPPNVRQALSNVWQKKGRLALTGITLMLAVGAFMGVTAVFSSTNEVIGTAFDTFDYEIGLTPNNRTDLATMQTVLADVDHFEAVYPGISSFAKIEGYTDPQLQTNELGVIGIDPTTGVAELNLSEGDGWTNDPNREGIVLTFSVADSLGVELGDNIEVAFGGEPVQLEVIGIDQFPFDLAYMHWEQLGRLSGFTEGGVAPADEYWTVLETSETPIAALGISESFGDLLPVDLAAGEFPTSENPGVVISRALADEQGLSVGDTLAVNGDAQDASYTVTGIVNIPPEFAGAFLQSDIQLLEDVAALFSGGQPLRFAFVPYSSLVDIEGASASGQALPNTYFVKLDYSDPTSGEVEQVKNEIRDALQVAGIPSTLTNQVEIEEMQAEQINVISYIFNISAAVMAAVGAIGLLTTLSMSVFERQKEIGVMRSIGASSSTVAMQFLIEGILVSVIAWIIGVPFSYGLSLMLMEGLPFGDFVQFTYPLYILIVGLIGIVVVATVASLWPSASAARRTVSEILRYQ